MIFLLKKIYYSIFKKNYNFTKTLINLYYTGKKKLSYLFQALAVVSDLLRMRNFLILQKNIMYSLLEISLDLGLTILTWN